MSDFKIPPEAVEALREELRMSRLCADPATARAAIRAALAAWPEAQKGFSPVAGVPLLMLPLPKEARDE